MKIQVEKETLIRLAAIAIAFDHLIPNRTEYDELASKLLRNEINEIPLTVTEYKDMMERAFTLMELERA